MALTSPGTSASKRAHPLPSDPMSPVPDFFVPDFREVRAALLLVVVSALLAFVLVLFEQGPGPEFWPRAAMAVFFVLWVSLPAAGLLSLLRGWLATLSPGVAGSVALAVVLGLTALVSLCGAMLGVLGANEGGLTGPRLVGNLVIAAIASSVALHYLYLQHEWRLRVELESKARMAALQARIRPHFLFNSMNTIASLTRADPRLAEQVTEDLADLFRATLEGMTSHSSLGSELDLAERYLRIESLRLGSRLTVSLVRDGLPADAVVPSLLLQPLMENAVYHGIEPCAAGGDVRLSGALENGEVRIDIDNSLPGPDEARRGAGNQIAQRSVAALLQGLFGEAVSFAADERDGRYAIAMRFPYRPLGDNHGITDIGTLSP